MNKQKIKDRIKKRLPKWTLESYRKIRYYNKERTKNKYLSRLLKNRCLPVEKLRDIQLKKFRKLVAHAYKNVPFYREKYDKAGISPDSIKTEEDIKKIPILTKEEFRANFPDKIISRKANIKRCFIVKTSGSTGSPLSYIVSRREDKLRSAVREFTRHMAGCGKSQTLIHMQTVDKEDLNRLFDKKPRFRLSPHADLSSKLEIFDKIMPDYILGYPSFIFEMADKLESLDYSFKKPLKGVLLTGEMITPIIRDKIEHVFRARIFDAYGTSETTDAACECSNHNMHEIMEHAYIEIMDNKTKESRETGEVIITDLDKYDMPFIRYKTGDIARRSEEKCSCGMTSPIIANIEGRSQDFLVTTKGGLVSPFIFTGIISPFREKGLVSAVKRFQVVQKPNKDIIIRLVSSEEIGDEAKNKLIGFTRNHIGKVDVTIKRLKRIPSEPSGKTKIVISKIIKDSQMS